MARGGKRVGTAGKKYTNRSDLQRGARAPSTPRVAPASSAQPYGQQAAQLRSLEALPLANAAATSPALPASAPAEAPGVPLNVPPMNRPTERPGEPVTTGIATGPGAGPEALGPPPLSADMEGLRSWLPALELLASSPDASDATRMMVRDIRGRIR